MNGSDISTGLLPKPSYAMLMSMDRPPEDWHRLASYVISARREAGFMEQRALAAATGITDRTIGKLERGERVGPATLAAVAKALDWTPDSPQNILEGGEPVKRQALVGRVVPFPSLPPVEETDPWYLELPDGLTEEEIGPYVAELSMRFMSVTATQPGERPATDGERVFPDDHVAAWQWDGLAAQGMSPRAAVRFFGAAMAQRAKGTLPRRGRGGG